MCRLYASLGPTSPPPQELIDFGALCTTGCAGPHADGWGLVAYDASGRPSTVVKSLAPAASDPLLPQTARALEGRPLVVAHLRKRSNGGVVIENNHPFVHGRWTFAHNGTIHDPYAQKMAPGLGLNDSRALVLRMQETLDDDPLEALRGAIHEVRAGGFDYTSITTVLTDGARLFVTRDARTREDYYTMRYRVESGRVVFCQEPLGRGEWTDLPNGHVAIARAGAIEVLAL